MMATAGTDANAAVTQPAGNPDVDALIEGAGLGQRLGGRPKAFVMLGDRTLLEIAVSAVARVCGRVIVAVPPGTEEAAKRLVGGRAEVIAGGDSRLESTRLLLAAATATVAMLHDVVHPLTSTALAREVLAKALVAGAASAAVPMASYVHAEDAGGPNDTLLGAWIPEARWTLQKPICARVATLLEGLKRYDSDPTLAGAREPGATSLLQLVGQRVDVVACPSWNVKLTTADDLDLCRALLSAGLGTLA